MMRAQVNNMLRRFRPRRFHAYSVGTAKSGTTSIASIFAANYRSAHEPDERELIDHILSYESPEAVGPFAVGARDRRLRLELDSSQLNIFIVPDLVRVFPDARFILTMRDCFSWLDSFINHSLSRTCNERWRRMRDFRFRRGTLKHPPQEKALADHGLYTLEGYFSYWAFHNRRALEMIPCDRLLVVKATQISQALPRLAEFVSVPLDTLSAWASHANPALVSHNLLAELPIDHLNRVARAHCAPIMERHFPEACTW